MNYKSLKITNKGNDILSQIYKGLKMTNKGK